jgi:hypothetical protein
MLIAGAGLASRLAWAREVTAAQVGQARAVVEAQLRAFADDDAVKAFLLSSQAVRERFGSPDRFMAMIRRRYPMVCRPASVAFLKPQWEDSDLMQSVQMTDAQGSGWLATFRLQPQPKGAWLIAGCRVEPSEGSFT